MSTIHGLLYHIICKWTSSYYFGNLQIALNCKIDFDLTLIFQLLNLGFQRNSKVICVHFKSAFNVQGTPLWLLLHISPIKNERDIVVRTFSSSILSPLLSKPSRCCGENVFFYLFSGGCHQKPPGALSCHLPWHHRVQAADRGWRQRSRWNRRWLNNFPFLFCLQESLSFSFKAKSKPFLNIRHCIDLKLTWNCWIPFIMLLL